METDEERWAWVKGFRGIFQVSDHGRVRSVNRIVMQCSSTGKEYGRLIPGKIKKLSSNRRGYKRVNLQINNIPKVYLVHRLVAIAFIGNPDRLPEVNHKDLCSFNNLYSNLEWCTHVENVAHAFSNGVMTGAKAPRKGSKCHLSKLTEKKVILIREMLSNNVPVKYISKKFGINKNNISFIKNRKTWKHI